MAIQPLRLRDLARNHYGLTPALANSYLEAARVCLDCDHTSPTDFALQDDDRTIDLLVEWDETDQRVRAAWANLDDVRRDGAYACALAATGAARNTEPED